jgi:outer membrane protein OmpA-like peptidoglycan-associated protein
MKLGVAILRWAAPSARRRALLLGAVAAGLLSLIAATPYARAQESLVFGRYREVIVNLDALDDLGPPPEQAQPPRRQPRGHVRTPQGIPGEQGMIVLTPPKSTAAGRTPRKAAPKAEHKTARGADHKAALRAERAARRSAEPHKPQVAEAGALPIPPMPPPNPGVEAAPSAEGAAPPISERKTTQAAAALSAPPAPQRAAGQPAAAQVGAPTPPPPPPPSVMQPPPPPPSKPAAAPLENPVADLLPPTKPAKSTPPPQVAAKPMEPGPSAAGQAKDEKALTINFRSGSADLPESAKAELGGVVAQLAKNTRENLQVVAYAAGTSDQQSEARRLSFARALVVRGYLVDQGVSDTRIFVRALGNKIEGSGPADRVDLVLVNQ